MPTIPEFPTPLLDQHHAWHAPGAHGSTSGGRVNPMGTPGAGREFLVFHRNFMAQFRAWYDNHTFTTPPFDDPAQKADLVAPWAEVPDVLKQPAYGWNAGWQAQANRLDTLTPPFATDDELGTFIEMGIHNNFLHGAAAQHFSEPVLGSFHSPQSSYFYKIHGLVDHWWSAWQTANKPRIAEIDPQIFKPLVRELVKPVVREVFKRVADVKVGVRDELVNPLRKFRDPIEIARMQERIAMLERQVQIQTSTLIRAEERPAVGEAVTGATIPHRRNPEHQHDPVKR